MKNTHTLIGSNERTFLADVFEADQKAKGIVVFSHGFKGFKDWGTFPLMAQHFAKQNLHCITFNFSHNGTTVEQPYNFADLEAFGNNNFSKELFDLNTAIEFAVKHFHAQEVALPIFLLGHSRGGGISLLAAYENPLVEKVAVWGSVNEFGKFWKNNEMLRLQQDGVIYIPNARTNQQMPIYKQLYENYEANKERLHIPSKVKLLHKPLLIVHGTNDETVPLQSAIELKQWKPDAELLVIENANHTFGGKHPFNESELPTHFNYALEKTIGFFLQ
jgi:alpha-beta hydrolase superfamily lysophospholipase